MSKKEKVVCAALSIGYETSERCNNEMRLNGVDWSLIRGSDAYKEIRIFLGVTSTREGFTTSKDRFVDPVEAKKISVYNDNRVDYGIYKEMDRLRKEIAKANNKRNRGDLSVELSLNILMNKYSELEVKLNEFRGRDYLLPEDLY